MKTKVTDTGMVYMYLRIWLTIIATTVILALVFIIRLSGSNVFLIYLSPFVWLLCIYFLSEWQTGLIYNLILRVTRNRKIAVSWITLLLLPGTAVHELSHLISASILGVRVGKFTLEPEPLKDEHVTVGSVMIGETDPFRHYAIGMAPVFSGIILLAAISYFFDPVSSAASGQIISGSFINRDTGLMLLLLYLIFSVSSTMFSSKEDLAGFTGFIAAITAVSIPVIFLAGKLGLSVPAIPFNIEPTVRPVFKYLGYSLSLIIIIQAVSFLLLLFINLLLNGLVFNFRSSSRRRK